MFDGSVYPKHLMQMPEYFPDIQYNHRKTHYSAGRSCATRWLAACEHPGNEDAQRRCIVLQKQCTNSRATIIHIYASDTIVGPLDVNVLEMFLGYVSPSLMDLVAPKS
jgi:hypothetical protein